MSEQLVTGEDDLLRLWQESLLPAPEPEHLARSIGRLQLAGFDRAVRRHDLREYLGFVLLLLFYTGQWLLGGNRLQAAVAVAGALFVVCYLWRRHRGLTPLNPAADGRAYQAALLERIDAHIRLLRSIRYWYLLPLYPPVLWTVAETWPRNPVVAATGFVIMTACYAAVAWLCERSAIRHLQATRDRAAALYREEA